MVKAILRPLSLREKTYPQSSAGGFFVANGLRNNFFGNEAIDATARKEVIAS